MPRRKKGKKKANSEDQIKKIAEMMETLLEDTSIPKNIRKAISEAKDKLLGEGDPVFRASSAIYSLETVSEDINMPMHARTQIWSIVSALETIKEE